MLYVGLVDFQWAEPDGREEGEEKGEFERGESQITPWVFANGGEAGNFSCGNHHQMVFCYLIWYESTNKHHLGSCLTNQLISPYHDSFAECFTHYLSENAQLLKWLIKYKNLVQSFTWKHRPELLAFFLHTFSLSQTLKMNSSMCLNCSYVALL